MSKNIVVCCDGTCNDVIDDSTNVLRLFRSLLRDGRQVAYYDSGVGTLADPTRITTFGKRASKKLDAGAGLSVRENVCQAYSFLASRFEPGDRIYLYGFSRGAYTVRALAGMIHLLGLVPPELAGLATLGWAIFANDDESLAVGERFEAAARFKKSFAVEKDVRVHFVGAWDTVSAFGYIWSFRTVPHSANNPSIDHVRHAVSIDEHRACFQANLFRPKREDQHASYKERWFAGAHAEVGGGYPEAEDGLAKIALEWMLHESEELGLLVDSQQRDLLLGHGGGKYSRPDPRAPAHNSTTGLWHCLEWLPRKQWDHEAKPPRFRWFWPNRYRRRKIPDGVMMHPSVKEKLENDENYRPPNLPTEFSYSS